MLHFVLSHINLMLSLINFLVSKIINRYFLEIDRNSVLFETVKNRLNMYWDIGGMYQYVNVRNYFARDEYWTRFIYN